MDSLDSSSLRWWLPLPREARAVPPRAVRPQASWNPLTVEPVPFPTSLKCPAEAPQPLQLSPRSLPAPLGRPNSSSNRLEMSTCSIKRFACMAAAHACMLAAFSGTQRGVVHTAYSHSFLSELWGRGEVYCFVCPCVRSLGNPESILLCHCEPSLKLKIPSLLTIPILASVAVYNRCSPPIPRTDVVVSHRGC